MQLDLQLASALSGKALGNGLLQLWEIQNQSELHVRVIPRDELSADFMLKFDTKKLCKQMQTKLDTMWGSDPAKGVVAVFYTLESLGFQVDDLEDELSEVQGSDEAPASLIKLVERFIKSVAKQSEQPRIQFFETDDPMFQFFGSFARVQYSLV